MSNAKNINDVIHEEEKDDLGGDPVDPFGEPLPTCNECGELAYFIDYSGFAGEYETFWCKKHEKGHPLAE